MTTKYYDYFTMPDWLAQHVEDFASNLGEVVDGERYIVNNVDEGLRMVCRIEPMPKPTATPDYPLKLELVQTLPPLAKAEGGQHDAVEEDPS